jgi:hypothetical protein
MKKLIILISLFQIINAKAQTNNMNDISDYSYFLFDKNDNKMNHGTGFFIKHLNKHYLVTASHNFHSDKTAKVKTSEIFYIRLKRKIDNQFEIIPINNSPLAKTEISKNIDINFYEISPSSEFYINVVSMETTELKMSDEIICFGYAPKDGNDDNAQLYIETLEPTQFKGKIKFNYKEPIKYFETQEKDYYNYAVEYSSETLKRGTSGSPVFSISKKNGANIYNFAGLIHTRNELTKVAMVLRPEKIEELIKPQ